MYANDHGEAKSIRASVDMKPPPFDYARAESVDEAVALLAKHGDEAKIIAGGQSLMPMLAFRMAEPRLLVDIGSISKLRGIEISERGVTLGALVRWCDIERQPELSHAHPLLVEAIKHVAHYQIRNRGTVGGSLAHADPAADRQPRTIPFAARIAPAADPELYLDAARDFTVVPRGMDSSGCDPALDG